jgi:hypothetical protein
MSISAHTAADASAVQDLSLRFANVFQNPDSAEAVFSADAIFDLNTQARCLCEERGAHHVRPAC